MIRLDWRRANRVCWIAETKFVSVKRRCIFYLDRAWAFGLRSLIFELCTWSFELCVWSQRFLIKVQSTKYKVPKTKVPKPKAQDRNLRKLSMTANVAEA